MSQQISQQQQNFFLAVLNFFKPSNKIEIIDKHGNRFINLFIMCKSIHLVLTVKVFLFRFTTFYI